MGATATVTNINQGKREMPSETGYVSLWRDINKQAWSKNVFYYGVFTKLLTMVQHKDYSTTYKNVDVDLKAGEFVTCYSDIMNMFNEFTDKDHAKRIVKKFKSLGQIYTKELKDGKVNIGFILGFKRWNKWQNQTPPLTTPPTPPEAANLKVLEGGKTTPQTTPQTTHINNNVFNKLKDSDRQANLKLLKSAYEHMWKKWKSCKSNIGKTDTSPKAKTFDKNFKSIFNQSYFNKNSQDVFRAEINQICKFMDKAHSIEGFNRFENMQLPKFLNEKQWRD
jgi:hypothetical protein